MDNLKGMNFKSSILLLVSMFFVLASASAQELIINQKSISNVWKTFETYFDFIRTGYPQYDFHYMIQNVDNTTTFPRRFPYPAAEIEKNPNVAEVGQSDWFMKRTTWDNK